MQEIDRKFPIFDLFHKRLEKPNIPFHFYVSFYEDFRLFKTWQPQVSAGTLQANEHIWSFSERERTIEAQG